MEELPISPGVAWVIVATFTGGGLWFVIRLVHKYQRDFTNYYAARNVELEDENDKLRLALYEQQRQEIVTRVELGAARATLAQHKIPWNPTLWGAEFAPSAAAFMPPIRSHPPVPPSTPDVEEPPGPESRP